MTANVVQLAERASDTIAITELEPQPKNGVPVFIGKRIECDGTIVGYPKVTWWRQSVALIPATVPALFVYLREARKRNICLIRGAPANPERQPTRRQRAHEVYHGKDRGDHGFLDAPSKLFFLDVDGFVAPWRADPEAAVRDIVTQLGEPWASTSFVWSFSASHGLALDEHKRWTGRLSNDKVRVRIAFITDRALSWEEADQLTKLAKVRVPKLDISICRVVQPNYIRRAQWVEHPDCDVLGDIPTIGRVTGKHEQLTVPDDLAHRARWAKAQGHNVELADHPDAVAAVRGIGSDASIRSHLMSAVMHLLLANPVPDVVSYADHANAIVEQLHGRSAPR